MNTANLQLQGLCMAVAALNELLVNKGIVSRDELRAILSEAVTAVEPQEPNELSSANRKAITFPIRLLILANEAQTQTIGLDFGDLARSTAQLDDPA